MKRTGIIKAFGIRMQRASDLNKLLFTVKRRIKTESAEAKIIINAKRKSLGSRERGFCMSYDLSICTNRIEGSAKEKKSVSIVLNIFSLLSFFLIINAIVMPVMKKSEKDVIEEIISTIKLLYIFILKMQYIFSGTVVPKNTIFRYRLLKKKYIFGGEKPGAHSHIIPGSCIMME
jgi:hypothetical protein